MYEKYLVFLLIEEILHWCHKLHLFLFQIQTKMEAGVDVSVLNLYNVNQNFKCFFSDSGVYFILEWGWNQYSKKVP